MSNNEIRVIDLNTNEFIASAPLAQAKATPATRMGGFYERRYAPRGLPVLVVCVPGVQRLTIGCIEPSQKLRADEALAHFVAGQGSARKRPCIPRLGPRLADARREIRLGSTTARQSADAASGAVAEFQLSASAPPPLYSQPRYAKRFHRLSLVYLAFCILFMLTLIIDAAVLHQWRPHGHAWSQPDGLLHVFE